VPLLGDLPGLGMAFRHDSKVRNKANLIVFITPTIVQDADFQVAQSDFLKNKVVDKTDKEWSNWDSSEPYDWTKAKKKKAAQE
jgi:type II secretory pathway component GspD/PulD (secretin)